MGGMSTVAVPILLAVTGLMSQVHPGITTPLSTDSSAIVPSCSEVCEYDDWFLRANCDEKDLYQVPLPLGCEIAIILELQDNRIQRIDGECFSGYRNVKTLDISRNEIFIVYPESFLTLNQLRNILMSHNHLTNIWNGTFSGTENNLQRIYLNDNHLTNMSERAFNGLSGVFSLYLNYNHLESLPPTVFSDLVGLRYLFLSNNRLTGIASNTFYGLVNLETLFLDNNELTSLPGELFTGLESLKEVDLSHNNLVSIPSQHIGFNSLQVLNMEDNNLTPGSVVLPYLGIAQMLYVGGNPFNCDRDFLVVQQWYLNQTKTDPIHYVHRRPLQCVAYNISDTTTENSFPTEEIVSTTYHPPGMVVSDKSNGFTTQTESKKEPATSRTGNSVPVADVSAENSHGSGIHGTACKSHEGPVYCAAILTVFFVLWTVKSLGQLIKFFRSSTVQEKVVEM